MSELAEQLDEIEGKLVDLRNDLRKMDYHAPTYLKNSLNDLKDITYGLFRAVRALESRVESDSIGGKL
jgi:hypothetical protein